MVKFTAALVAALAVLAPVAEAKTCKKSITYCGYILLQRGNYYDQIRGALSDAGKPSNDANWINQSRFYCVGGSDGSIRYVDHCSSCKNGGNGHSDFC
ncbi:hypothetical protein FGLOB1_10200 [Fusarium globosum]|uniref:Uncharacterized protein n=1 Tax=Fusarium globosum TaxID=78864 RepID=A0A8H5XX64_9HYPO|nr:hypothetical protein FGLOB1_10200 [Fusarium globosum]